MPNLYSCVFSFWLSATVARSTYRRLLRHRQARCSHRRVKLDVTNERLRFTRCVIGAGLSTCRSSRPRHQRPEAGIHGTDLQRFGGSHVRHDLWRKQSFLERSLGTESKRSAPRLLCRCLYMRFLAERRNEIHKAQLVVRIVRSVQRRFRWIKLGFDCKGWFFCHRLDDHQLGGRKRSARRT